MFTKPKEFYEGKKACKKGVSRDRNPYIYLGSRARGKEVWWYTGWDEANSLKTSNLESKDNG